MARLCKLIKWLNAIYGIDLERNDKEKKKTLYIDRVPHFYLKLKAYFSYQYANMDPFDHPTTSSPQFSNSLILPDKS